MKSKVTTFLLIVVALAGVCLLAYPTLSDWWNSNNQSRAVASYKNAVMAADDSELAETLEEAFAYNARLAEEGNSWLLDDERMTEYESQLALNDSGIMGYVEIPKIGCTLPIYHGTDEAVLQVAIGHIEGSSLPVGGKSTHSVVSGHRGLPSARLFTDLDQLKEGDKFFLHVLDEELAYEVDQILIVEPDDVAALEIVEGEDLCTLVTCTPYGVNSHRLLVRGHRVEAQDAEALVVPADANLVDDGIVAFSLALPLLAMAGIGALVLRKR